MNPFFNKIQREMFVKVVREFVDETYTGDNLNLACLTYAQACLEAFLRLRIPAVIQAGSASYQRVSDERMEDESEQHTHFSYVWENQMDNVQLAMYAEYLLAQTRGGRDSFQLPEIHVWIAIPMTHEIIDVTTRYVPENCEKLTGLPFDGPPVPDFFWWCPDDGPLPTNMVYQPDAQACMFAMRLLGLDVWSDQLGAQQVR